jgi:hypothetical protein
LPGFPGRAPVLHPFCALFHQGLADTLKMCFSAQKLTRIWK